MSYLRGGDTHTHTHTHTHTQADKKRNRAKLIEFFADTALECRKLNNYNSYMAISGEGVGGERWRVRGGWPYYVMEAPPLRDLFA